MLITNHMFVTNDGCYLLNQARSEHKQLVFTVHMTTEYATDEYPYSGKEKSWYGDVAGEIIGCLSHVTVNNVLYTCQTKLAVKCTDPSQSWSTVSLWAKLEGSDKNEILFACLSRKVSEHFKNVGVIIFELSSTLAGVVDDFGFQECSTQNPSTGISPRSVSLLTKEDDGGYSMHLTNLEAENIDAHSITLNGSDLETIIRRICDARIAQSMNGSGSSSSSSS